MKKENTRQVGACRLSRRGFCLEFSLGTRDRQSHHPQGQRVTLVSGGYLFKIVSKDLRQVIEDLALTFVLGVPTQVRVLVSLGVLT